MKTTSNQVSSATISTKPIAGFSNIIKTLTKDHRIFLESAYQSLYRLLTYDQRLPIIQGMDGLNDTEIELFNAMKNNQQISISVQPQTIFQDEHVEFLIFFNNFGRLHIRSVDEHLPEYCKGVTHETVGYVYIPKPICTDIHESVQNIINSETRLRANIDAFLTKKEYSGELQEAIDMIDDAVRHVEDIYIYVDDEIFSVVGDRQTNLIETPNGQGLFNQLRKNPVQKWTPAQRLIFAGLWFLFLCGRSIRFEEFNGKLMTACRLSARLHKFLEDYGQFGANVEYNIDLSTECELFAIAKRVGEIARQSVGQKWLRYRMVNGLNFWKSEKLTSSPQSSETDKFIPESIASLYQSWVGKDFNLTLGYVSLFNELADAAISASTLSHEISVNSPAKKPVEILIQEIVASAVTATNSDYGMSSSIQDPSVLINEDYPNFLAEMLKLKPKDFYTCVVSRYGLRQKLGITLYEQVCRAVQARMTYNRWHFIPGNFDRKDIPFDRHYFYPPLVPDMTEWADQQHQGHILASVRYSIRAPGPDMSQPPLLIAKRPYRGFYDVRVVRMEGSPFTLEDMIAVRHHNLWMGVLWNRIVTHCENNPGSIKISGFEKGQYYEPSLNVSTDFDIYTALRK